MNAAFTLFPFIAIGVTLLFVTLGGRNPVWNCVLLLVPTLTATVYPAFLGKSVLEVSTQGSVVERLKYLVVILGPLILGVIGTLNESRTASKNEEGSNRVLIPSLFIILLFPLLQLSAVFQLRPINGVGQSVYVPLCTSLASIFLIIFISFERVDLYSLKVATEYILTGTFLILFVNSLTDFKDWPSNSGVFFESGQESFRFSPFANLLNSQSRQSFFESDPERFALFALLAFSVLLTSENTFRRYFVCCVIFAIGSTTQSRLFYLGVIITLLMQFCKKFVLHRSKIPQSFFLIGIITSYIFLMTNVGNSSENDLATINGRTYIWRIVVDHWNDSGFLFGHAGAYSLFSYSNDNSTLFEIYHAHNLVLQILWDWGIIGLILGLPLILVLLNGYMKVGWSGFVIGTLIFIEGLIEPVLSFNVQATGTLFLILYIKYVTTALSSQSRSVP